MNLPGLMSFSFMSMELVICSSGFSSGAAPLRSPTCCGRWLTGSRNTTRKPLL